MTSPADLVRVPAVADRYGVTALPGPGVLGGQDLAVAADSRSPRTAQRLIEFLTSAASQKQLFADGGFAAVRAGTYSDADVLARRPYATALRTAVDRARPRPVTPHYTNFTAAFREVVRYAREHPGELPPGATRTLADALRGLR